VKRYFGEEERNINEALIKLFLRQKSEVESCKLHQILIKPDPFLLTYRSIV